MARQAAIRGGFVNETGTRQAAIRGGVLEETGGTISFLSARVMGAGRGAPAGALTAPALARVAGVGSDRPTGTLVGSGSARSAGAGAERASPGIAAPAALRTLGAGQDRVATSPAAAAAARLAGGGADRSAGTAIASARVSTSGAGADRSAATLASSAKVTTRGAGWLYGTLINAGVLVINGAARAFGMGRGQSLPSSTIAGGATERGSGIGGAGSAPVLGAAVRVSGAGRSAPGTTAAGMLTAKSSGVGWARQVARSTLYGIASTFGAGRAAIAAAIGPVLRVAAQTPWRLTALPWQRASTALAWARGITAGQTRMPQVLDITPPFDAVIDIGVIQFDFGRWLAPAVSITGVSEITLAVVKGTDDTPESRINGSPVVTRSRSTGANQAQVNQLFGPFPTAARYLVTCVVDVSSGERLSLWSHLDVVTPT